MMRGTRRRGLSVLAAVFLFWSAASVSAEDAGTALVPSGKYLRFFVPRRGSENKDAAAAKREPIAVPAFFLDRRAVTNGEFLDFVKTNPEWRRSKVPAVFAESSYLKHWKSDLSLSSVEDADRPVTWVSWFAAKAYCESYGMTLPTTDQWEYAAENAGRDAGAIEKAILAWYEKSGTDPLPRAGSGTKNVYGVSDLLGVVWEWTLDFNGTFIGSEFRDDGSKDGDLFCGAGALGALNPSNYATFMRFSFRASLGAAFTVANLGFRCAKESE